MRKTTPVAKAVEGILYSSFRGNSATRNGLQQEHFTIEEYKLYMAEKGSNVSVEPRGLIVNSQFPFLGASVDGWVTETIGSTTSVGVMECKNVLHRKPYNLYEAARKDGSFCLNVDAQGKLSVKKSHVYYFQIQGQMAITNVKWCDFVVRCVDPHQLHVQRVFFDEELAVPRHGKHPGIREPGENWVCLYIFTVNFLSTCNMQVFSMLISGSHCNVFLYEPTRFWY